MKSLSRRISIALLAGGLMITPAVAEVHAVSWGNILRGAINIGSTHAAVDAMDRDQEGMLRETQARTGVYADSAYQERAKRIIRDLQDTGIPERSYVIYINPSEDINAFCTLAGVLSVNKGLMDIMDDDCLAFVLAHEISHGEHRDSVNGITKQVTLANAAGIALGNAGAAEAIVANIALQYVNNEVFTMNQEKNADKLGFTILERSKYNVGGAAAAMQSLLEYHGDSGATGIVRIIAPNTHPRSSDRVDIALKRLHEFSRKHVTVRESTVIMNGHDVLTAAASGRYSAPMRAQLAGGKLARLFHDDAVAASTARGRTVMMSGVALYTASTAAEAQAIATRLTAAVTPTAPSKSESAVPVVRPTAEKKDTAAPQSPSKTSDNAAGSDILSRVQAILHK